MMRIKYAITALAVACGVGASAFTGAAPASASTGTDAAGSSLVSNVMKTKHDAAKNAINNVR